MESEVEPLTSPCEATNMVGKEDIQSENTPEEVPDSNDDFESKADDHTDSSQDDFGNDILASNSSSSLLSEGKEALLKERTAAFAKTLVQQTFHEKKRQPPKAALKDSHYPSSPFENLASKNGAFDMAGTANAAAAVSSSPTSSSLGASSFHHHRTSYSAEAKEVHVDMAHRHQRAASVIGNPGNAHLYHLIKHERHVGQKVQLRESFLQIQKAVQIWSQRCDPQRLLSETMAELEYCFPGCKIRLGLLQSGGQALRYEVTTQGSEALGKSLLRGEGVSFHAVDTGEHICITGSQDLSTRPASSRYETPLPIDSKPKLLTKGSPKDLPLLILPLEAEQRCCLGVLTIDHFSQHNEKDGWEYTSSRREVLAQRSLLFQQSLRTGNDMKRFKLWRHSTHRSEGGVVEEEPLSSFTSAAMVAGRIVEVKVHQRWGPSYTVQWEDGLKEMDVGQQSMEALVRVEKERLGYGAYIDADVIEIGKQMAAAIARGLDHCRKRQCLERVRNLTKTFLTTIEDVYRAGLKAVVDNVLMNRTAEIWKVRQLSNLAYDVESLAVMNAEGDFEKRKMKKFLDDWPKPARRWFFEQLFPSYTAKQNRLRGTKGGEAGLPLLVPFTMPNIPEIIIVPFCDDGDVHTYRRPRVLRVLIVEAKRLAIAKKGIFGGAGRPDPYVIAKLQGKEIHRTSARPNTCNPQWNDDEEGTSTTSSFSVTLPTEPWQSEVVLEVWDMAKGGAQGMFLGQAILSLEDLLFPTLGIKEFELKPRPEHIAVDLPVVQGIICVSVRPQEANQQKVLLDGGWHATPLKRSAADPAIEGDDGTIQEKEEGGLGIDAAAISSAASHVSGTTSSSSSGGHPVPVLKLHILEARGLTNIGSLFGGSKADPYCLIKWNNKEVGRTKVMHKTLDPVWEKEVFDVPLLDHPTPGKLSIEIWGKSGIGLDSFMGRLALSNERLYADDDGKGQQDYPLFSREADEEHQQQSPAQSLGKIVLQFNIVNRASEEAGLPQELVGTTSSSKDLLIIHPPSSSSSPPSPPSKSFVKLQIHKACGLAKADFFGASNPFCIIKWNGQELGRTKVVYHTLNPVWTEKESFDVALKDEVDSSRLVLEVWDMDALMMGDFLGQVSLKPAMLRGGRKVMEGYALKRSKAMEEAKQKLVQGVLFMSHQFFDPLLVHGGQASSSGLPLEATIPIVEKDNSLHKKEKIESKAYGRLTVEVHRAVGLRRIGFLSKPDPYYVVRYNGQEIRRSAPSGNKTQEPDFAAEPAIVIPLSPQKGIGNAVAEEEVLLHDLYVELWTTASSNQPQAQGGQLLGQVLITAEALKKPSQSTAYALQDSVAGKAMPGSLFISSFLRLDEGKKRKGIPAKLEEEISSLPEKSSCKDLIQADVSSKGKDKSEKSSSPVTLVLSSLRGLSAGSRTTILAATDKSPAQKASSSPSSLSPGQSLGLLHVRILEGHGLGKADAAGTSDPFCIVIWDGKEVGRTAVIQETLDPVWGEDAHFNLPLRGNAGESILCIEVWDMNDDGVGEFLGLVSLSAEQLMGPSNGLIVRPLGCKAGMDKRAQRLVQGELTLCWEYNPPGSDISMLDEERGGMQRASSTNVGAAVGARDVVYALVANRVSSCSWSGDVKFTGQVAPELDVALRCVRSREVRTQERHQCLRELKRLTQKWENVPYKRLLVTARYVLERCLPECDAYIALLEEGGKMLTYVESTQRSKMMGQRLKAGEGVSFASLLSLRPVIIHRKDMDLAQAPTCFAGGDRVLIRYGRVDYPGRIVRWATFESYDVIYDGIGEKEAGVPLSRLTWLARDVPPLKKFSSSGRLGWPYLCVPLRYGSVGLGVVGMDGLDRLAKGRDDEEPPEEGVVDFVCEIGRLLGTALDMQRKAKGLSQLANVIKDPKATVHDVLAMAVSVITQVVLFVHKVEAWEEVIDSPATLRRLISQGKFVLEADKRLRRDVASLEPMDVLNTVRGQIMQQQSGEGGNQQQPQQQQQALGRQRSLQKLKKQGTKRGDLKASKDPEDHVFVREYAAFPSILIGRFKSLELRSQEGRSETANSSIDNYDDEGIQKINWMILYREPGITWTEDADYLNSICQAMTKAYMCIYSREFRARARGRIIGHILKLCQEWTDLDTRRLITKVVDGLGRCFLGSQVYVGLLLPGSDVLEFRASTQGSTMAGKRMARGRGGVAFGVIDQRQQIVIRLFNTPEAMRLRVFTGSLTECLPFVSTPLRRGERTVRGVLNVDSIGRNDDDEHPEPDELSILETIATALGTTIDIKSKEMAMKDLVAEANKANVTVSDIYKAAMRVLRFNIPLARSVERWCFPLLTLKVGADTKEEGGQEGGLRDNRPWRILLDIHSAEGLAKADLFGKSHPFCIIRWNGEEIGRTEAIPNTLDPVWTEEHFAFPWSILGGGSSSVGKEGRVSLTTMMTLSTSSMIIEVWDMDALGPGDFLGQVQIRGSELMSMMKLVPSSSQAQEGVNSPSSYELKCKPGQDPKTQTLVQGRLCLSVMVEEDDGEEVVTQISSPEVKIKREIDDVLKKAAGEDKFADAFIHLLASSSSPSPPPASADNAPPSPLLKLHVQSAVGLAKADLFGKSDPFCIISWNGVEIGKTKVIDKTLDPIWENEHFHVPITGHLSDGLLMIEVYEMNRTGRGSFLGQLLLEGEQLRKGGRATREGVVEYHLKAKSSLEGGSSEAGWLSPSRTLGGKKLAIQGKLRISYEYIEHPDRPPALKASLQATIIKLMGLSKAKVTKAESLYIIMNYVGKEASSTGLVDLAEGLPVWAAGSSILLQAQSDGGRHLEEYEITFELWEKTKQGTEQCLACASLTEDIFRTFNPNKDQILTLTSAAAAPQSPTGRNGGSVSPSDIVAKLVLQCQTVIRPEDNPEWIADEELSILNLQIYRAKGLAKADLFGKSDPYCIVKWKDREVGRTKVIYKTLDPVWSKEQFMINMEKDVGSTALTIEVWDQDVIGAGDFLGQVTILRRDLKSCTDGQVSFDLKARPGVYSKEQAFVKGSLFVNYSKASKEDTEAFSSLIKLEIMDAHGLAKADLFGKSDPFCIIKWNDREVGKTKVISKTLNPVWDDENFTIPQTGGGDPLTGQLCIEVWDMDANGVGDFLGQVTFKGDDLLLPKEETIRFELKPKDDATAAASKFVKGWLGLKYHVVGLDGKMMRRERCDGDDDEAGQEEGMEDELLDDDTANVLDKTDELVLHVRVLKCEGLLPSPAPSDDTSSAVIATATAEEGSVYCLIKSHRKKLGRTSSITFCDSPTWQQNGGGDYVSISNPFVTLPIPKNRTKTCLQVEIWSKTASSGNEERLAWLEVKGDLIVHAPVGPRRYRLKRKDDDPKLYPKFESYITLEMIPDAKLWATCSKTLHQKPALLLHITDARGLAKADLFGNSDPFCVVKWEKGKVIGQTKVIDNTLNPDWQEEYFELPVPEDPTTTDLVIEVWDWDNNGVEDFLGQVVLTYGAVMRLPAERLEYVLKEESSSQGDGGGVGGKKKSSQFVQGVLGFSIQPKPISRNNLLQYETRPYVKGYENDKPQKAAVGPQDVTLQAMGLHSVFQTASEPSPSSCILYEEQEIVLASFTDLRVKVGEAFVGPSESCHRFSLVSTGPPGFSTSEDAGFAREVIAEVQRSLRQIRGVELRIATRALALQRLDLICGEWFNYHQLNDLYTAIFKTLDLCLLGCDIYVGLVEKGGQLLRYVHATSESDMLGKVLKRGRGISFHCIGKGYKSFLLVESPSKDITTISKLKASGIIARRRKSINTNKAASSSTSVILTKANNREVSTTSLVDRVRVLGDRSRASLPLVLCPLLYGRCTIGVLGCDNFDQMGNRQDLNLPHPEPGVTDFLKSAASLMGAAIDKKRRYDALISMDHLVNHPLAQPEELYAHCIKAALGNIPFAVKAQIWKLDHSWQLHVLNSLSYADEDKTGARTLRISNTALTFFSAKVQSALFGASGDVRQQQAKEKQQQQQKKREESSSYCYIKFACGGSERKSTLRAASDHPHWDEQYNFKIGPSIVCLYGDVWVVDAESGRRKVVATARFDLSEMKLDSKLTMWAYLQEVGGSGSLNDSTMVKKPKEAVGKMTLEVLAQKVVNLAIKAKDRGMSNRSVRLKVLEANNLAKADQSLGTSNPYVVVKWRENKMGRTEVMEKTLDPSWDGEVFNLNMPEEYAQEDLVFEVYSQEKEKDDGHAGIFLGQAMMKGDKLMALATAFLTEADLTANLILQDRPVSKWAGRGKKKILIKGEIVFSAELREGSFVEGRVGMVDKKLKNQLMLLVHGVRKSMGVFGDHEVTRSALQNSILRLRVVDAHGLSSALSTTTAALLQEGQQEQGCVCIIRVNGIEQGRTSVIYTNNHAPKWNRASIDDCSMLLTFPPYKMKEVELCIEMWAVSSPSSPSSSSASSSDSNHQQQRQHLYTSDAFLGQVSFRGDRLHRIPKGDVDYDLERKPRTHRPSLASSTTLFKEYDDQHVQGALCLNMSWTTIQPQETGYALTKSGGSVAHLDWSTKPSSIPPPSSVPPALAPGVIILRLDILACQDLARGDTPPFGSSDPYVVIKWCGQEVGRTVVFWNTLNPIYQDAIFYVPIESGEEEMEGAALVLEVWDKDVVGFGDLLGTLTIPGDDIFINYRESLQSLVRPDHSKQGFINFNLSRWDPTFSAEVIEINIMEAHGLAQADFLGKSDPVVLLYWNHKEVRRTRVIQKTFDPVWNETFLLHLPSNRQDISLRLEIWDMDLGKLGDFLGEINIGPDEILQPSGEKEKYRLEPKHGQEQNKKKSKYVQGYLQLRWMHRRLYLCEVPPERIPALPRPEASSTMVSDIMIADDPVAEELRRKREGVKLPGLAAKTQALAELCDSVLGNPKYQMGPGVKAVKKKFAGTDNVKTTTTSLPVSAGGLMMRTHGEEDDDGSGSECWDSDEEHDRHLAEEEQEQAATMKQPAAESSSSLLAEISSGQVVTTFVRRIACTVLRGILYDRLVVTFYDDAEEAQNGPSAGYAIVVYCRAKEVYTEDRDFGKLLAQRLTEELTIIRRRQGRLEQCHQAYYRLVALCRFDEEAVPRSILPAPSIYDPVPRLSDAVRGLCERALKVLEGCRNTQCVTSIYLLSPSLAGGVAEGGIAQPVLNLIASTLIHQGAENSTNKTVIEEKKGSQDLYRALHEGLVVLLTEECVRVGHVTWPTMSQPEMMLENKRINSSSSSSSSSAAAAAEEEALIIPLWNKDKAIGVIEITGIRNLSLEVPKPVRLLDAASDANTSKESSSSEDDSPLSTTPLVLEAGLLDFLKTSATTLGSYIDEQRKREIFEGIQSLTIKSKEEHGIARVLRYVAKGIKAICPHATAVRVWQMTIDQESLGMLEKEEAESSLKLPLLSKANSSAKTMKKSQVPTNGGSATTTTQMTRKGLIDPELTVIKDLAQTSKAALSEQIDEEEKKDDAGGGEGEGAKDDEAGTYQEDEEDEAAPEALTNSLITKSDSKRQTKMNKTWGIVNDLRNSLKTASSTIASVLSSGLWNDEESSSNRAAAALVDFKPTTYKIPAEAQFVIKTTDASLSITRAGAFNWETLALTSSRIALLAREWHRALRQQQQQQQQKNQQQPIYHFWSSADYLVIMIRKTISISNETEKKAGSGSSGSIRNKTKNVEEAKVAERIEWAIAIKGSLTAADIRFLIEAGRLASDVLNEK